MVAEGCRFSHGGGQIPTTHPYLHGSAVCPELATERRVGERMGMPRVQEQTLFTKIYRLWKLPAQSACDVILLDGALSSRLIGGTEHIWVCPVFATDRGTEHIWVCPMLVTERGDGAHMVCPVLVTERGNGARMV